MAEGAAASVVGITCPACGAALEIRAAGYTVTLVCQYCGSTLDTANSDVRLISRLSEEQGRLKIPLGTRGTLRGIEWQAIGFLRRVSQGSRWEEYLLFNPYHGYRWLVRDNDHWSFGTMLTASPEVGYEPVWQGHSYRAFYNRATAQVEYVLGEFYWRVAVGETVTTASYVRSGAMLTMEENEAERSWTLNEYLPPAEIEAVFPSAFARRWHLGDTPAPHQPSPYARLFKPWRNITLAAMAVLLVSYITMPSPAPVGRFEIPATMGQSTTTRTFGPIRVAAPWQGMTVRTETSSIDQGWVDIDAAFVDQKTQESYEIYSLNEHYDGMDSDGYWSEGDRTQTVKVASLPAGTYNLVVEVGAHAWSNSAWSSASGSSGSEPRRTVNVAISVYWGAVFYSNIALALTFVLLPFLILWWMQYMFDKARFEDMDRPPTLEDWMAGYGRPS